MSARLPVLPYAGTSGWSGSESSRARAAADDSTGATAHRQSVVLRSLGAAGHAGLTWRELSGQTGWHHGQASGALSALHKSGRIARLREARGRCKVYVLPQFADGRPTEPHGHRRGAAEAERMAVLEWLHAEADHAVRVGDLRGRQVLLRVADAVGRGEHLP